jgi:hypothetical protein
VKNIETSLYYEEIRQIRNYKFLKHVFHEKSDRLSQMPKPKFDKRSKKGNGEPRGTVGISLQM